MNRRKGRCLAGALVVGVVLAGAANVGSAASVCLRASFTCSAPIELTAQRIRVSPQTLPRGKPVPIAFSGGARISTGDGLHPPALRQAVLQIDRNVEIDAEGLPACGYRKIASHDPVEASRLCHEAIVGSGEAKVELTYPENTPIVVETELTLFNGGVRDGVTRLFIHGFIAIPVPRAIVASVEMSKQPDGEHGWLARIEIPRIGDGYGSLIEFSVKAKRIFLHGGARKSYLSARCPSGRLPFAAPELRFENEAGIPGRPALTVLKVGVLVPCTPRQ